MAKSRSKTSLEEAALQGSYCAGEGLVCLLSRLSVGSVEGKCSLHRDNAFIPALQYRPSCGTHWLCYRMRMATTSGQWMPQCREQCVLTVPSLLLSPPPVPFPTLVLTWACGDKETRQDFHGALSLPLLEKRFNYLSKESRGNLQSPSLQYKWLC